MKIIDTFMYFDEDLVLDIRLNTLNNFIHKFLICESKFSHNGKPKKLNFNINNFQKFKDKIEYIVLDHQPNHLLKINSNDSDRVKKSKILDNALLRENYQRNFCFDTLKKFSEEDLVLINDLDEIPNLKNFRYNFKITIFKQKMFYYKLNLEFPDFTWMGSKICKIKNLISPQWLRNVKSKKYPYWRVDAIFDKKKYFNLGFIESGGWHFTNIMSPEKIDFKMRSFLHHLEYEESGFNIQKLKELVKNKKIMYDHNADKKNQAKWQNEKKLKRIGLEQLPEYIQSNFSNLSSWID